MRKISYHCNLCGQEFPEIMIKGLNFDKERKLTSFVIPYYSEDHICEPCLKMIESGLQMTDPT